MLIEAQESGVFDEQLFTGGEWELVGVHVLDRTMKCGI